MAAEPGLQLKPHEPLPVGRARAKEGGLLTLAQILEIFGARMFRARGAQDYLSQMPELRKGFMKTIAEVTGGHPFWGIPGR